MALDNIERPPTEVGSNQIAIRLFLGIFDGHDEPFGFVDADIQPRTPDQGHHLLTASDTDAVERPRMNDEVVGDVLVPGAGPNVLIAADLREHLYTIEQA